MTRHPDDSEARRAALTVLDRSLGPDDARALLGALGLTGALHGYESAPPPEVLVEQPVEAPTPEPAGPEGA